MTAARPPTTATEPHTNTRGRKDNRPQSGNLPLRMPATVSVLCMKWGSMYGAEYVNRLRAGVRRNLARPHRFVCFTDDASGLAPDIEVRPLPTLGLPAGHQDRRWQKLALFGRDLGDVTGTALFLDLDVVIVGDLEPFFEMPGEFLIIRDDDLFRRKPLRFLKPERNRFLSTVGNSSVFRYQVGAHSYILDAYVADPRAALADFRISQQFQSAQLAAHGHLQYWPREWCVSFKNDCVPRYAMSYLRDPQPPPGARIVVFAGSPKMSEVLAGEGHRWSRKIGRIDWLRRHWHE